MKILITTPDLNKMGGVANYYRVLRQYLPETVQYLRQISAGCIKVQSHQLSKPILTQLHELGQRLCKVEKKYYCY